MSMTPQIPFLSIVLPTYNVGKYIDRCLRSCVNQTYRNIEIIIVDDCGDDDSISKAEVWALNDDRVKIVKNFTNLGTYHARRIGTEAASGTYILYLDPDDELKDNAIEVIHANTSGRIVDIIFFGQQQIPCAKALLKTAKLPRPAYRSKSPGIAILKTRNLKCGTPGKAYSRATTREAFKFLNVAEELRIVYAEDALLFYGILLYTKTFLSIHENLYLYHRNDSSITANPSPSSKLFKSKQIDLIVEIILKHAQTKTDLISDEVNIEISRKIVGKLISDKYLLERYIPSTNRSKYLRCVFKSMLSRKSAADAVRVLAFISSFGLVKL